MNKVRAKQPFVEASIANCILAVLTVMVKVNLEQINRIIASLNLAAISKPAFDGAAGAATRLEQIRNTCSNYLSLISLVLVFVAAIYFKRSNERRVFPALSLLLAIVSFILTILTE